jgi:5,10-methylenetetrahydromethanopterin reductase
MRVGIHASVTGRGENAVDELVQLARTAHGHGLAFWTAQLSDIDALTALAVVGREVPDLDFGTAVVPTYGRHPLVMAMQALTVQAASGGRLTLGIGLSHQVVIEGAFGLSFSTPIRHMREYLEILMPLLHTGQVSFEGKEFTARTMGPMRPAGSAPPPVVVAALGSQMLHLAGRLADGTALWMVGPKTLADHVVPAITKAAEAAGRPSPRIVVGLPVCVTSDSGAARERAAKSFGFYNNLPSYRAMLDREGVEGPADVAVIGDEDQVAGELRRLIGLGATEFSLPVFGSSEERERTLTVLGALALE